SVNADRISVTKLQSGPLILYHFLTVEAEAVRLCLSPKSQQAGDEQNNNIDASWKYPQFHSPGSLKTKLYFFCELRVIVERVRIPHRGPVGGFLRWLPHKYF